MTAPPLTRPAAGPVVPVRTPDDGHTLVIVNPHAAGGLARSVWKTVETPMRRAFGPVRAHITERPGDVAALVCHAYDAGARRVIAVGGDGTNHALINALCALQREQPDARMVCGLLPVGTGRDWARGLGLPMRDPAALVSWLAHARPYPTDVGEIRGIGGDPAAVRCFLNIASAGLGSAVTGYVNAAPVRRPWTFLAATLRALATYQPPPVAITVDGRPWFEGRAYVAAVCNGTTFGHGMRIAPHALPNDGLLDCVLVKNTARWRILAALRRVYDGSHLSHPAVSSARGRHIVITPLERAARFGIELDGEPDTSAGLTCTVRPGALDLLR
jgi:diacylglycerol kinase (ATP)